jgi:hypothetical protein
MHRAALPVALALAALVPAPALAQGGTCVFTIDQAQSSLTFSGTTSLGPIVGNPATVPLSGTLAVDLATEGNPVSTGQMAGGDLLVVGGISAAVPNPIPIFPPLASIAISNLHLSAVSPPFLGDLAGAFDTEVIITALSGTADVVPLVGAPSTVDLAGAVSDPTPSSGTVTQNGNILTVTVPFSSTIDLSDPMSGITGTAIMSGTIVATHDLTSGCNTTMFTGLDPLSLLAGGIADFNLDAGPSNANAFYWIFGSVTGTAPGTLLGTVLVPLNFDAFFKLTLFKPFLGVFQNFLGFLGSDGEGFAGFFIPAGADPGLAGLVLDFAYAAGPSIGTTTFASNAVSVVLGV